MRGVYHNQYEFNDNFKADIENGESALTLYFFTNDDLLLLKFQTGTYVLTFETDSDETSKEMLDHFINRFKIEFAQYGNNRSNVQVSFIFNTDSTDYPCEEIGKCNLRIKVLDTNTNKIFFDFPQQFIFHAYVQLSRK
jgi:hypothetical protein